MSVNNKRTEIRKELVTIISAELAGFTIDKNRVIGIPLEKIPAITIMGPDETWTEDPSRCGNRVAGQGVIRIIQIGKLPPNLETGNPLDDQLDSTAKKIENVLTGVGTIKTPFTLNGLTLWFRLSGASYNFANDDKETIGNLDMNFEYEYILSYPNIIPPPPPPPP